MNPVTLAIVQMGAAPETPLLRAWSEVEHAPGFLDKHEYGKDERQSSWFLTRWTDADSFYTWLHGLPEDLQGASLRVLHVIKDLTAPENSFAMDVLPLLDEFLRQDTVLHVIQVKRDGTIVAVTPAVEAQLKMPASELRGNTIWSLLADADARLLRGALVSGAHPASGLLLNFLDAKGLPFTLSCLIGRSAGGFILLGALPARPKRLQQRLLKINDQLAVAVRDYAYRSRALERALARLQSDLESVNEAFSAVMRSMEPLPVCLECGKLKATDSEWIDVPAVHDLPHLLSHGYCPECIRRVRKHVEREGESRARDKRQA